MCIIFGIISFIKNNLQSKNILFNFLLQGSQIFPLMNWSSLSQLKKREREKKKEKKREKKKL